MGLSQSLSDYTKNITQIEGLRANSASPTDTWIVTYKKGKNDYQRLFWKIFIDSKKFKKDLTIYGLKYEIKVYKEIILPLIEESVCPFFVKYVHHFDDVEYKELVGLFKTENFKTLESIFTGRVDDAYTNYDKLRESIGNLHYNRKYLHCRSFQNSKVNKDYCKDRREVLRIATDPDYYAEEEEEDKPHPDEEELELDESKYNILITECTPFNKYEYDEKDVDRVNPIMTEGTFTFKNFLKSKISDPKYNYFYKVLFQICVACYSMNLSKMLHNDLHTSNIFVVQLKEYELFVFYINEKRYTLYTDLKVLVYDFDRSYCERLGQNECLNKYICSMGSCSKFTKLLDFFKVGCHLNNQFQDHKVDITGIMSSRPDKLYEMYTKKDEKRDRERNELYDRCFLTQNCINYLNTSKNLYSYEKILDNIYNKIEKEEVSLLDKTIERKVFNINSKNFSAEGILDVNLQRNDMVAKINKEEELKIKIDGGGVGRRRVKSPKKGRRSAKK